MSTSPEIERKLDIGYDDFAEQPFYRMVNASLLRLAPRVNTVIDLATGTGAMTKILFELDRIIPSENSSVYGFDIDTQGFDKAEKKIAEVNKFGVQVHFREGNFDSIDAPDRSCQLVILGNGPHTSENLQTTYLENARILVDEGLKVSPKDLLTTSQYCQRFPLAIEDDPVRINFKLDEEFYKHNGGIALLNTAYVRGLSYPEGTDIIWRDITLGARKLIRERFGVQKFEHPEDRFKYSIMDHFNAADRVGFHFAQAFTYTAEMDLAAMQAICKYGEFAAGALPGIDKDAAAQALFDSVPKVFDKYGIASVPRTWGLLVFRK